MGPDRFVFAHLADAHVGAWPRDPAIRSALRESLVSALRVAEERNAEFLLISGDLFHTPVPDPGEVAPVAAALRRFVDHGRRIYVIYGSHDYVAHRTSWLDVLAETGVFLKARARGGPLRRHPMDPPLPSGRTDRRPHRGDSGRSHGLDREYLREVDSEAFRAEPGFRVFQFHAAVEEYLPENLREHIHGIRRDDLPLGCDYYAGGHIHYTYVGEGPGGGLLVNPGGGIRDEPHGPRERPGGADPPGCRHRDRRERTTESRVRRHGASERHPPGRRGCLGKDCGRSPLGA